MKALTLSRLIEVLGSVPGSGHPAFFETPDGKRWEPVKVTNTREVSTGADRIETVITLQEVK